MPSRTAAQVSREPLAERGSGTSRGLCLPPATETHGAHEERRLSRGAQCEDFRGLLGLNVASLVNTALVKVALGPPQLANRDRFKSHQPPPITISIPIAGNSSSYLLRREVRAAFRACRSVRQALRGDL